jgi:uncharacterized repeat protein (TIGR02543 family)
MKTKNKLIITAMALLAIITMSLAVVGCEKEPDPKTFTVTFNSNGGSDVKTQTVNEGEKIAEPQGVTKDKNALIAWYKEDTFTNKWNFANDTVTADITLYAKWIQREFIIKINDYKEIKVVDNRSGENDKTLEDDSLGIIEKLEKALITCKNNTNFPTVVERGITIEVEITEDYANTKVYGAKNLGVNLNYMLADSFSDSSFASIIGTRLNTMAGMLVAKAIQPKHDRGWQKMNIARTRNNNHIVGVYATVPDTKNA